MTSVHQECVDYGTNAEGQINYVKGAYIVGFVKVAGAMLVYGVH